MRTGYGHMMLDHMVHRVREMRALRARHLAGLQTVQDALAYREHARETVARAFAPAPPKTPLNARVTGRIQCPDYAIEKVIFESRPGLLVTANLYLPNDLDGPAPCVLGACGHSANGKAYAAYQGFAQRLAMNGFVVLIYDPINQGERDQYASLEDRGNMDRSTFAHNMMGKQLELIGENFAMWRAWDGVRALDYLLSRPEVDPSRVGLTGCSGGGTMTTWLWAMDPRFTMAAPDCFVTTFLHNLENELPADAEQYPPGVLGAGLEMADLLIAAAPKPIILLGEHYCYFDRRGHQEACDDLRRIYDILGAPPENVDCFRSDHPHGYSAECQEAMVAFFARHAGTAYRPIAETVALPDADLWCAPGGEVMAAGNKPVYAFIAERAAELATERPALDPPALRERLSELLHLPADWGVPHYRNLRPDRTGDAVYGRYAIETAGDIRAILRKRMAHPERANALDVDRVVRLYLPHYSAEVELAHDPWALALQADAAPDAGELYALDVRGLGESAPDEVGSFWHPYGIDYMMHGHYRMLGESYLGWRVLDLLRTVSLLANMGAAEIHLYGRGQGALVALFAAVLDDRIPSLAMRNAPRSFQEWATTPIVDWPAASFLQGVLGALDLDDCLRALGNRVTVSEPWGPRLQAIEES